MKNFIWIVIALIVGIAALFYLKVSEPIVSPTASPTISQSVSPIPTPSATPDHSNLIQVTSPTANAVVTSPLTVTGKARGTWYFEASFPVKIYDANGKLLGQTPAQAQGEWMTTDFVPFKATLTFSTSTTTTGTLVLEKDNPSGLSQFDDHIEIPVRFDSSAVSARTVNLYYYDPNKDKDSSGNILCSSKGLVAVQRELPSSTTPLKDSIALLIKGELTAAEKSRGISTEYPLSGFELTMASITNGVATLTFKDPENKTTGGACRVNVLWAQIEATAKQFSTVSSVKYKPDTLFQP